jgi:hypothetical protein
MSKTIVFLAQININTGIEKTLSDGGKKGGLPCIHSHGRVISPADAGGRHKRIGGPTIRQYTGRPLY